jgi:hypothetical protein
MPYVNKSSDGSIQGISLVDLNSVGWEFVNADDEAYLKFLDNTIAAQNPFRESDIHLARVLEDLIGLLIERDVIRFTDFPEAAQKRLNDRQLLRKSSRSQNLIDEGKSIFSSDFDR